MIEGIAAAARRLDRDREALANRLLTDVVDSRSGRRVASKVASSSTGAAGRAPSGSPRRSLIERISVAPRARSSSELRTPREWLPRRHFWADLGEHALGLGRR
jgi:hypothetical protein